MTLSPDSVILITGASSGIGAALALGLAARGARLGLIARRTEMLEETAAAARTAGAADVIAATCDVADRDAFAATVLSLHDRFGHVDVLVHNAGSGHRGYIEETPPEHIEAVFGVNVFALWYGTAPLLPLMVARGSGHIIVVSSFAGVFPFPGNAAYVAAKHAALGFSRALRAELVDTGVESSVVLPAGVMTEWAASTIGGSLLPLFAYEGERGAEIAAQKGITPPSMPSLLHPADVAAEIARLIEHPVPELYTHAGTHELAVDYLRDPKNLDERLAPSWEAMREGVRKGIGAKE